MVAIIEYNAGNIASVANALQRLGVPSIVTANEAEIRKAEKVIFPGVGEASSAMQHLHASGLAQLIPTLQQPVLGICLGQQLLCRFSEEGSTFCLGIFDAEVKKFPPLDLVPHVGWNNLQHTKGQLFEGIAEDENFYFVHSFYCTLSPETVAECDYILPFGAAMQKNNFYATQFHPEKSASIGEKILSNFLKITP